jgi:hypothetical protein
VSGLLLAGAVLADNDSDKGSPIGLFVVLVLVVAVYFLYRSLSKHVRRIPESFDPVDPAVPSDPPAVVADPTDAADVPHDAGERTGPN